MSSYIHSCSADDAGDPDGGDCFSPYDLSVKVLCANSSNGP